jgi:hypothetical protein
MRKYCCMCIWAKLSARLNDYECRNTCRTLHCSRRNSSENTIRNGWRFIDIVAEICQSNKVVMAILNMVVMTFWFEYSPLKVDKSLTSFTISDLH